MDKKQPLVSVIVPTYNRGSLIGRAIRCIQHQSITDLEILIVDDGSTDDTKEVVARLEEQDHRIKYLYQAHSGCIASPMNRGIKASAGKYITFHASDDESAPEWLEKQLTLLNNPRKRIDVASCNITVFDEESGERKEVVKPAIKDNEYLIRSSILNNYLFGNIVVRRDIFDKVGLFDENLVIREDFDMWVRLLQAGCVFDFAYEPLYTVRVHSSQASSLVTDALRTRILRYLMRKHKKLYPKSSTSRELRELGVSQMLAGNTRDARRSFIKALIVHPLNLRAYINLLLSFLGKQFPNPR